MKIKLVYPKIKEVISFDLAKKFLEIRSSAIPLAIPTLAALTPNTFEVVISDENIKQIKFDDDTDIIGINYNTHNAKRAYDIADEFKRHKKTVIMGGIHASMRPEEALRHCDAVVVGESENLWPSVLNDFLKNELKPIYKSNESIDLNKSVIPRWDLIDTRRYFFTPIQISRGCPHNCEFCLDSNYYGRKVRLKPVEQVIKELDFLYKNERTRPIMFGDYNFLNDFDYTKRITSHLKKLKFKNWMIFANISIGHKHGILNLLAKGGCSIINVGIESVSQDSLTALGRKTYKACELEKLINNIRSYGIDVYAGFMFGSDNDTPQIFKETIDFINYMNILFPQINILQPYPGSDLYNRLKEENRLIFGEEWEKYERYKVCFKPKKMTIEQLQEGYDMTVKKLFSYESLFDRLNYLVQRGFYTRERFEKQTRNYSARIISKIIPKIWPFFTRDQQLKAFLKLCNLQPVKPSLQFLLVAIGYHQSYVSHFGQEF